MKKQERKTSVTKLTPSQLVKKQLTGNGFFDEALQKPRIIQFLNLADYSINTQSYVNIDEPLFEAIPPVICFSDYQPLQIKQKVFKLRNKDRFSRRVKIIQPDSKLFQILIPNDLKTNTKLQSGTKVAAGMETKFVVRFSPEAKIDYKYELIVVTQRQKFIVPIYAVGKRAMIDFPDILDFGACPVKFSTQKPVIIRNLGEKTTKWALQLPQGFNSNQREGVLQPGKNQQIVVKFYPLQAKLYKNVAKLEYDKLAAYVQLLGVGQLSNVYLSRTVISMEQSYIGLQSQQTLHIMNKSNVKVSFQWRAFSSQKQQKPKKQLLYQQLQQEQAQQLMLLREVINSSQKNQQQENQAADDSSSEEQFDHRQYLQRKRKRAQLSLARKYQTIRKAIQDDLFLFQDQIFRIQPLVGEIWPNSQITITVTFMPVTASTYDCMAYCNISCAEQRLPLKLKGQGLGPKAYLTQQQINFGDIFVNQPIKQTIQIQNRGQIPCHFTLQKPERAFAKMFEFSVEQRTLQVGQNCSFQIKFKSSIPGQFKQKFRWQLHGSQRNLQMTFLGHVIAPTFEFVDPNDSLKVKPQINFGKVSYDFDYKEGIILKNTSSVEFTYNLKILSQNKILQNQFRIHPQSGTIPQKSEKLIQIQFNPKSIKKYETVMTIDIQGVGNDMLSVPIKADCQIPNVDITPAQKVEFAQACLNYPQTRIIQLKNNSDLKAKFNIVPQSQQSKVLAKYSVVPQYGVIDQRQSKQLEITLITCKLGQITLPLYLNIVGTNNNQPCLLNICANSDGPKVTVTPQQLDFGQVEVLKDYTLKVTIVNNSKIKAQFHAFTRQKISIFKPKIKHSFLEPGEKLQFDVICNADDASKFNDILHFVVKDGKDKDIILKAKGVGSTIFSDDNLEQLDFGNIYTFKTAVKEIFIQNRGRKSQKITWQRKKLIDKKKSKQQQQKQQEQIVFTIDPQTQTIPPKYGRYFKFVAMSQKKGKISEQFLLLSQVGNQRKANQLKIMNIQGQFTQPNIIYSEKKINFKYIWQKTVPAVPLEKQLILTSGASLPMNFTLKTAMPFSISQQNHFLQPGATTKIKVFFDPNFKIDKVSGILNGKINVVFPDHPHKQTVQLVGQVCFPNLKIETTIVNFGAILNDTTKKISIFMKNVSYMPVTYEWAFLEDQVLGQQQKMNMSSNSLMQNNTTPINQIFDILPLSGKLDPDQIQQVEFIYNAQGGILYRATAICHIQGGPNYQVKLEGDSSLISGKISQKQLDYGQLRFCQWATKEIFLQNTGKVTYQYKVDLQKVKRKSFLDISPMQGKIAGGQKQKLTIKVCPTMPEIFQEQFDIQMGYYDPQTIKIVGEGVYPSLVCQFPRIQGNEFEQKIKQDMDKFTKQNEGSLKKTSKDKIKKKQNKSVEQYKQQLQKQFDRTHYCDLINKQIEGYVKPQKPPANNIETKLFDNIYLTHWVCDFGNVIVGTTQKKVLKFKNIGQYPIEMAFDTKVLKLTDYKITPQKSKLAPGEQVSINVTLATKKNSKFGKQISSIILEVKNGAKYKVQLISNLTVPQIIIDGNPQGIIDFGKVLCGQRKIVTLRFLNLKQISCDWSLNLRDPVGSDKQQLKFELVPSSGKIASGSFQIVQAIFFPSQQKQYMAKFPIKIQQNPKILNTQLKGIGSSINCEAFPQKITIGPVFPYTQNAYSYIHITNPTKYPTELISLDFDKRFKKDIQTLSLYQGIKNGEEKDKKNTVFLPLRQPGSKLWPEVIKQVQKQKKIQQLKSKIASAAQNEKQSFEKQLQKLSENDQIVSYPRKVTSQNMLHLILYGPQKSGKSYVALNLQNLYKKCIINLDQIVDWHINMGTDIGKQITQFLSNRKKQLQNALAQRQKQFKKAGKKAKQLEDKLGPASQQKYQYITEQMWLKVIQQRIKHPQCGAGCVFDNLKSKHVQNQETAISLIFKALGNQSCNLVLLEAEKKKQQSEEKIKTQTQQKIQQKEDTFQIKDFSDEGEKTKYLQKVDFVCKMTRNQIDSDKIPSIIIYKDPVLGEQNPQGSQNQNQNLMHLGSRQIIYFPIKNSAQKQEKSIKQIIPAPIYPDPMTEPLPEPTFQEMIQRHTGKIFQSKLLKEFTVFTPKDKFIPYKKPEKKDDKKNKIRKDKNQQVEPVVQCLKVQEDFNIQNFNQEDTRWVIPAESTLRLLVKFYSKTQGNFQSTLTFQNSFNLKKITVPIKGKTEFPSLNNLPKNIFNNIKKKRPTTLPDCYLSKAYVQAQNVFDFGPLLIGKSVDKKNEKEMININSSVFKFLNNSPFTAEVEFAFLSSIIEGKPEYNKNVFSVSVNRMEIQSSNTPKQLRVWAVPIEARQYKDELIVMIKNNPIPVVLPLKCLGSKPTIQILQGSPMVFTRIILNQVIKRQLKFKNTSAVPIKFKLNGVQSLPKQFSVNIKQGKLKPNQESEIQITFKAIQQQKFSNVIKLVAQDIQNLNLTSPPIDIPIEAEAFDISVDLKFPTDNSENMLDFGSLRVGDFVDKTFSVKNIGLYKVKLAFIMKKKLYKQSFKIEPMQFQLEPNANKQVVVRFSSLKQIKLKTNSNSTDIFMEVLQGKTMQTHKSVPINVNVNSVFSAYSIVPLKNMNFGPIQFNQSKTRVFQIKNEGLFQFNYSIFDNANQEFRKQLLQNVRKQRQSKLEAANNMTSATNTDPKKAGGKKQTKEVKKQAKKAGKGGKQQVGLKIGQWLINPVSGSVAPDSSAVIQVTFAGKGQQLFQQKLAIDVQNRNPNDQPNGIIYQVVAQSCIPGINTNRFDAIFEQQLVLASQQHSTNVMKQVKANVFFVQQRIFNFGTLVPSKQPQGIVQRIKIQNTNKIPCNVKFSVAKKSQNAIQQFAFDVQPKQAKIPAHQHQYVKIIFNPTIMASYAGLFTATVDNGESQPKSHKLSFQLRGEGALPTLKVQSPTDYADQRTLLVKFPKTRLGKTQTQAIKLKNQGSIPATAKFELTANQNFRFLDSNTASLTPKSYGSFMIMFEPRQVGVKVWQISCQTLLNQYQVIRFKVEGEAYVEDILLENLPNQEQDKINFDDLSINQSKTFTFSLRNNATKPIKFNWASHQNFQFKPSIGHLNSKTSKAISITFKSQKTVQFKDLVLNCQTIQINQQNNQEFVDWDNSMTVTRFITKTEFDWYQKKKEQDRKRRQEEAEQAKKGSKKDNKKAPKKEEKVQQEPPKPPANQEADIAFEQVIPEPQSSQIQKTQKAVSLKASAVADYAKYTISQKSIDFYPTMMYTSRSHKVSLKNTSTIKLHYSCKIVSAETGKIDAGFFSVSPHNGVILPNCQESFNIKFSPTEVEDVIRRLLSINIKNLDPSQQKLILQLDGQVERPICHFELAPSKYRQKNPDIQAKYNIIQFQSLGTKVKNTKRFYVINPTSLAYDFQWKKLQSDKDSNSGFFRCITTKGTILSGKKTQMIFQYIPDLVGSHRSYWTFEILGQNITQYFLIVGQVVEPNVFFDTGKINFGPLLIGGKNKQIINLKNLQDVPLAFNFDKQSIKGQMEWGNSLQIQPMSGVINSQGQSKIQILFEPKVSQSFNYNIVCNVKRRTQPVCLNVKGIGYILDHSVYLDGRPNALSKNEKQQINFGNIFINQIKQRKITIENNGDFNFDFAIKTNSLFPYLKFSHEYGTVKKNQKLSIDLTFQPTDQFAFKVNSAITLNIISGPTYTFLLRGASKRPGVDFSFFNYDFGPCFVLKQPLSVAAYLQIRNRQNVSMSIQSLFKKTDYLDVKIPSGQVILPLQIQQVKNKKGVKQRIQKNLLKIPIVFTPRQNSKYSEDLIFDINGLNKIIVKVKGQGVPLKLQLQKIQDQNIDFGITKVGGQAHRSVSLINNSKKKIQIDFNVQNQLEQLKKHSLSILPSGKLTINPRQKYNLQIIYKPNVRMGTFKSDILYQIVQNKQKKKLMNVTGCSHGIQMKLMQDTIGFGTVVMNSKITKTIQLSNFGDIGSKFEWDTTFCGKYFTISPEKGYIVPHQDLIFNVTFHPNVADNDIRFKVKCKVDGSESLFVNLVGKCIPQPADTIQELKFNCLVRQQAKQKITIKNPTPKPWNIKVSISSQQNLNYFSGKQTLQIPPNSQSDYEIFYRPLTMTKNQQVPEIKIDLHQASLFFPIPDGTALMYKLLGTAKPAGIIKTFDLTCKAKQNFIHLIPIKNWLKTAQRFNVDWKFDVEDKSVFINAATIFDLAGDSTKQFKLSLYGLKASQVKFTLWLRNPVSFQFISYKINLAITPSQPMKDIQLTSLVRQTCNKLITIQNPLSIPVQIKKQMIVIQSDVIYVSPNQFTIPAKSQFGFQVIFRPLIAKEENSKIHIKSPELGQFTYPLKLVGTASNSPRTLNFKTSLGSQQTHKFKFVHYGKKQTTYTCRVEKLGQKQPVNLDPKAKIPVVTTDFTVQTPTVVVPGSDSFEGTEAFVNVKFQPSSMAQSGCQLVVSSPDGGQYICMLKGYSSLPQPKGPFKINAKPPAIQFKNPFFQAYQFTVRIDNPSFTSTLKSPVKVDGKKVLSINLAYKAIPNTPANGRLTISTSDKLEWVFYLQGE